MPIKTAREVVNILQNHYPERLYTVFFYNPPRVFGAFWKVGILSFPQFLMPPKFQRFFSLSGVSGGLWTQPGPGEKALQGLQVGHL